LGTSYVDELATDSIISTVMPLAYFRLKLCSSLAHVTGCLKVTADCLLIDIKDVKDYPLDFSVVNLSGRMQWGFPTDVSCLIIFLPLNLRF
jgi:hypothetical protein